MNSRRLVTATYLLSTFGALAAIVLTYRRWLHVNPTTVALTLVLFVLLIAARLSLRYAVAASIVATACYNYFFLPPVGTFTIADPQNWLTLFAFLATSVIGSRLSQTAREEADQANARQRELEVLFALSRELLQTGNVADLIDALPALINAAARAQRSTLYLLDGDRVYETGEQRSSAEELSNFRVLALSLSAPEIMADAEVHIPLRAGVRPRGLLRLSGVHLSKDTLHAIGGLASIALDRAQALEDVARSEANKESERLRNLMLDSITHELRTPLTSIKGATGTLLSMDNITAEDRRELLTIIDEEADRLNHLIGQAVEMAQIEAKEVHMSFAPVDLRKLVAEALESCAWIATTHPVTMSIAELPAVNADRVMIAKVVCNLLENAAKYSEPNSPILVSAELKNGCVITSVADRGVGIETSEQSLIFDRLYRSRTHSQQKPGTGMGLPISRAIIDSHQGKLTVTSQLHHGSVFSFSLPTALRHSVNAS
jgi:two-component system sensor histidine kinase KdpD